MIDIEELARVRPLQGGYERIETKNKYHIGEIYGIRRMYLDKDLNFVAGKDERTNPTALVFDSYSEAKEFVSELKKDDKEEIDKHVKDYEKRQMAWTTSICNKI